ncbi:MAG TPA: CvpA family protein [Candidatus Limnocylindria bacterium]|nr:CvpA family protein [Candidatus Limnocylindria bacterium]
MNPVDLLLLAAFVLAAALGVRSGFIATLYGLVTWIVSIPVAFVAQVPGGSLIARVGFPAPVATTLAFVAVLLVVTSGFSVLGSAFVFPFVRRLHRDRVLSLADRLLGVLPAVLRALVIAAIGLAAAQVVPLQTDVRAAIEGSRIAQALIADVAAVRPQLGALAGNDEGAPVFVTKLAEDQTQKLDLPDGLSLAADPEAEQRLVVLVNQERTSRGLAALVLDSRLVSVAREHSQEMFRLKYFGHQSPLTGSPFDRLAAAQILYTRAGENLAYAQSVVVAHRGLMDSEGHRENILRTEFTRIGIGVISAGPYGRMVTQMFLTP